MLGNRDEPIIDAGASHRRVVVRTNDEALSLATEEPRDGVEFVDGRPLRGLQNGRD